jgi:hypothetical protein
VATKTIKVLERVAKQIVLRSLNKGSALGWASVQPNSDKLNIWVELLRAESNKDYPYSKYGVPEAPLVYKTSVAADVDASKIPLTFNIPDKLIVDLPTIQRCCGYTGDGYIFNVYGQDNTGTYLLVSSYGSGIGLSMWTDIRLTQFEITSGAAGTNLSLKGGFE